MKQRFPILALFTLLVCAPLRLEAQGGSFDLTPHTEPLADLSHAQWRFHPGDDPRYADPSFDDSSWPLLTADKPWDRQGYKGLTGFGWYRIHIKVPPNQPLTFVSGVVYNNCEVFADGKKIAQWGRMGPHPRPIYPHDLWSVVAPLPAHGGEVVIAVRIWAWFRTAAFQGGGFSGQDHLPVLLGSPEAIVPAVALRKSEKLVQTSAESILGILYVIAGLLALILYMKERESVEYLWFAIFAVTTGLHPLFYLAVSTWIPTLGIWFDCGEHLLEQIPGLVLIPFFFRFIGQPMTRIARWVLLIQSAEIVVSQLQSFLFFLSWKQWHLLTSFTNAILFTTIVWLVVAHWRRSRSVRRLALPMILLGVANLIEEASFVPFAMGLTGKLPPVFLHPVLFTQLDLAKLIFLGAMAFVLVERFAETHLERTRLGTEFEAARTVQQVLIPDKLPAIAGLAIESAYHPAQEVGGDFFQVLPLGDGAAFIVLGDVSGHGLKSAMTVSLIVGTLRTYAEFYRSPAKLLSGINRQLHGRGDGFATCIAMFIDAGGEVTLANAAHPNPYLNGQEFPTDSNLPLGILLDLDYAETRLHLAVGDRLTLLTDGVIEATNPATRELFGFTRTAHISTHSAQAIADEAQYFGAGGPQADDISVLTVVRV